MCSMENLSVVPVVQRKDIAILSVGNSDELNLAFSGLFMGLAAASKWIGIYAGAGLAILFFWHCIRIFRYHRKQADAVSGKAAKNKKASTAFKQGLSDRQADLHRE